MNVLDFVLIGIVLVAVIIGVKKGFAKMISRFLCIVVALGGSIAVTFILLTFVKQLSLFDGFVGVTTGWFSQFFMTTSVSSAEELKTLLSGEGVGFFSVLAGLSAKLFDGMSALGVSTLGEYLGRVVATAIFAFVIWLVCYLAIKYVVLGIRKLLRWLAGIPVIRSIDKIFGMIFSVAVWYVVVIGVLYSAFVIICAKFVPSLGSTMLSLVNGSTVFTYVHHTNVIGELLCNLFNVSYSTIAVL